MYVCLSLLAMQEVSRGAMRWYEVNGWTNRSVPCHMRVQGKGEKRKQDDTLVILKLITERQIIVIIAITTIGRRRRHRASIVITIIIPIIIVSSDIVVVGGGGRLGSRGTSGGVDDSGGGHRRGIVRCGGTRDGDNDATGGDWGDGNGAGDTKNLDKGNKTMLAICVIDRRADGHKSDVWRQTDKDGERT